MQRHTYIDLSAHTHGPRSDEVGGDGTPIEGPLTDGPPTDDPLTDADHADDPVSDGTSY